MLCEPVTCYVKIWGVGGEDLREASPHLSRQGIHFEEGSGKISYGKSWLSSCRPAGCHPEVPGHRREQWLTQSLGPAHPHPRILGKCENRVPLAPPEQFGQVSPGPPNPLLLAETFKTCDGQS